MTTYEYSFRYVPASDELTVRLTDDEEAGGKISHGSFDIWSGDQLFPAKVTLHNFALFTSYLSLREAMPSSLFDAIIDFQAHALRNKDTFKDTRSLAAA